MDVRNPGARDIFVGVKDRRLQSVEGIRQGVSFPAGATLSVPDALRLSKAFASLVTSGKLIIEGFGKDVTSTVQQEELTGGVGELEAFAISPLTTGQTLFLLPSLFKTGGFARVKINGIWYEKDDAFTITGSVFVWLKDPFSLDPADELLIWYEKGP